ncbi:MAG: phage minor head protein [Pseudomonadota bacterium]|nr:phage minor head protein [Pseudomonadota bacterium]
MTKKERDRKFKKARTQVLRQKTRLQRNTLAEIDRLLKLARDQVDAALAAAPSQFEAWYLPQLQQSITQAMKELGDQGAQVVSKNMGTSWQLGLDLVDKPIQAGGIQISAVLPAVDTKQLQAMRLFVTDRMKDVGVQLANKINSELGLVAIGAKSTGDATGTIAGMLKTGGRSRATTIIRTELGRAFSAASHQRKQQAAEHLPGLKKQWRRSGKLHSRQHHDAADGQIKNVDEPFVLHGKRGRVTLMYPRDPAAPIGETVNCGCESLPYMESWEMQSPGRKPYEPEELTTPFRRSLDAATSG